MVTLQEARQQVEQAKVQSQQVRTQLEEAKRNIPQTTERQLRGQVGGSGLAQRELQRKLKSSREGIQIESNKLDQYNRDINIADQQVTQAEVQQAEQDRQNYLLNRILSGQGVPMGTPEEEVKAVQQVIDTNPEYKKAVERVSTYQISSGNTPKNPFYEESMYSRLTQPDKSKLEGLNTTFSSIEVPADIQTEVISQSKIKGGVYEDPLTGNRISSISQPKGYVKVNDVIPYSSNKSLKGSVPNNINGFNVQSGLVTGMDIRIPNGDNTKLQSGNTRGSFLSGLGIGNKEGYKATQEAKIGNKTFVVVSARPIGSVSTEERKEFIPKEQIKTTTISQDLGKVTRFVGERTPVIKDIILSKDLVTKESRLSKEALTNFDTLDFEGQQKKIKEYTSLGGKVEEKEGKLYFTEPTRRVGFGRAVVDVPVSELADKSLFGYGATILGKVVGKSVEVTSSDLGLKGYTTKAYTTKVYQPQMGTTQIDLVTGERITGYKDLDIPSRSYFTPSQVGKGFEVATNLATFTPEVVGSFGEATLLGGEFGGQRGAVQFVKERPIDVAALATFGLLKGGSIALKPIVRVVEKPQTINLAFDIIKPTEKGFEEGRFLLVQRQFGGKVEVTNNFRDILGMKPKKVINIKPQTRVAVSTKIITKEGEIINNPLILQSKLGGKAVKISKLSGKQEQIAIESIESLPKTQQLTLQRLAEAKAGRPVSIKFVKDILGKDLQYSRGILESRDLLKVSSKGVVKRIPYGKTRNIAETTSTAELLASTPTSEVYLTETSLKDVTKVGRMTKKGVKVLGKNEKTGFITGLSVLKSVDRVDEVSGTILKLKSSPKSIQAIKQAEVLAQKSLPRVTIPKVNLPKSKAISITESSITRTIPKTSEISIQQTKQTEIEPSKVEGKMEQSLINITETKSNQKETSREMNILKSRQPEVLKQPTRLDESPRLKEIQLPKTKQETKQISKLASKQISKQIFKSSKTTPKSPTPKVPFGLGKAVKQVAQRMREEPDSFEVFVTKAGKDVSIGKKRTQQEAEVLLKSTLRSTLRAGGKIAKGETFLKATELKGFSGGEFGISKVSPIKIIQKRGFRLGTRSEVGEIQTFKKVKGKKSKSLFGI